MSETKRQIYGFNNFRLDAMNRQLLCDEQPVPLQGKAFDLLLFLVENRGRLIEKNELLDHIWNDQFVEEANLTVQMSAIRKALGERKDAPRYIHTVSGRGYRFIADVREVAEVTDELIIEKSSFSRIVIEEETDGGENKKTIDNVIEVDALQSASQTNGDGLLLPTSNTTTAIVPSAAPSVSQSRRWTPFIVGAALFVAITGLSFGVYRYFKQKNLVATPPPPPRSLKITRLPIDDKVEEAAISPDGRFIAYTVNDKAIQSIWLMQTGSNNPVQIYPPIDASLSGLIFSPDNKHIYFWQRKQGQPRELYRTTMLGGLPELIVRQIIGIISFSPDGSQIAYVRSEKGTTILATANADGSNERQLAERKNEEGFIEAGVAWSPNGKMIAVVAQNKSSERGEILGFKVDDGSFEKLAQQEWTLIKRLAWLNDGSGLILLAVKPSALGHDLFALWHLSYPGQELRQLTDSLGFFKRDSLSLTADSKSLVAVQMQGTRNIWTLPGADVARARQLTFDSVGFFTGYAGLSLLPDGGIVYARLVNEQQTIWTMTAEGKNKKQLTSDTYGSREPVVTNDGRYIVFQSNRTGSFEIWRMNADGSGAIQLTTGGNNTEPHCSPDGRWVVYRSQRGNIGTLWKVSIDGGESVQLTEKSSGWPQVSPDGKLILCAYGGGLAVIPFDGGEPIQTFKLHRAATAKNSLRWLPDSKSFTVRDLAHGIWRQSLDGGAPEKLPGIGEEKIYNYIWSADGKDLICSRGAVVNAVVLIEGFK